MMSQRNSRSSSSCRSVSIPESDISVTSMLPFSECGYEIPPTPNVTAEDSFQSIIPGEGKHKIVVLTRVTRFLPSHILNVLLSQEYIVRGVITYADNKEEMEALFALHPQARKFLFIQEVSPLNQRHWERAFDGADYVVHVVAPIASRSPILGEEVTPTCDVLKKVMAACVKVRTVQRMVLVTSVASIAWSPAMSEAGDYFDENNWEDEDNLTGYAKCQLACEKAAWNFINCLPEDERYELVVLNPAFVLGPMIQGKSTHSMAVIKGLMESSFDELPASNIPIVDVRDVAHAAAVALVKREAAGHRHILYGGTIWMEDIARILDKEFAKQGYPVLTNDKKKPVIEKKYCWQLKSKDEVEPDLLKFKHTACISYDSRRMQTVLGVEPHNPEETIIETAYSLIYWDMVSKEKPDDDEGTNTLWCFGRGKQKKNQRPKNTLSGRVASWF